MKRRIAVAALAAVVAITAAAPATAQDVDVWVRIPAQTEAPAQKRELDDAVFSWAINAEVGSGAYFGGCNFISAGVAGDAGSSRIWLAEDNLYRPQDGNVTVEKPVGAEQWATASWQNRCLDERGSESRPVTPEVGDYGTGNRVVITGGTGVVDPAKRSATLSWNGSFSIALYGGLTYFSLTDPKLTVVDGVGSLTAEASGYGASREDASLWGPLARKRVTIATLPAVELSAALGFQVIPAYRDRAVTVPDGYATQVREGPDWGAFPQDFIDYQDAVGQAAYWYSTGSLRDFAKPPYPVSVSWSAEERVDDEVPADVPAPGQAAPGGGSTPGALPTPTPTPTPMPNSSSSSVVAPVPGPVPVPAVPPAAASPTSSVAADAASGVGADPQATTPEPLLSSSGRGLIPAAAAALEDPRAFLVIASSALLALSAVALVGFRRGWLVLPWRKSSKPTPH